MGVLDEFGEILTAQEPLATHTNLGVGGSAEWLARPRDQEELGRLVERCWSEEIPCRLLGHGTNVLVADEGVRGVVICITAPAFRTISVAGTSVTAGAGADLMELIDHSCKARAAGLEDLVGIPGSLGGALRCNAGGRSGDIGEHVISVDMMDSNGKIATRMRADIRFGHRSSSLSDGIILGAAFDLIEDDPAVIVRRIKKIWIAKKAHQPLDVQSSVYAFQNPRGSSASDLIDTAGLGETKVGGAELSARDPRFIVTRKGATARDVLRLIDLVRSKVEDRLGVTLELQIDIWN